MAVVGVAPYRSTEEETDDWREEEPVSPDEQIGMSESDIKVQLATLAGDVKSQGKEMSSIRSSVEREIGRMAQALEKHADIVTRAVDSIKAEFVTRAEAAALNERIKKVEMVVFGAVGMIVVAVFGALIGLVVLK